MLNFNTLINNDSFMKKLKANCIDRKSITLSSIFLTGIILFSLIGASMVYADSVDFDIETNLSNNANDSVDAQVISSGSNVYVVWRDGDDIFFINSDDNGSSFANSATDIGDTGASNAFGNPQLTASGDNIYTIWQESGAIKFINSSDNGQTFANAAIQLSSSTIATSKMSQIDFSGSDTVYSVWLDDNPSGSDDIIFRKSTDAGVTFDSQIKIGETTAGFPSPQIASAGTNVYVVWQSASDILFSHSSDSGSSFSIASSIGSSSGKKIESAPQITTSASGADVYVVWQGSSDILVAHSSGSGNSFSAAIDIGNTGGANVSPFRVMSIAPKHAAIIQNAKNGV